MREGQDRLPKSRGLRKSGSELSDEDYLSIVGLGASGLANVSAEHDRYLGEAIADEHLR